jgi:hypothetical protein
MSMLAHLAGSLVVSNTSVLLADAVFSVTLTATNFMGASASSTVVVQIAGNPLPNVVMNSELVRADTVASLSRA